MTLAKLKHILDISVLRDDLSAEYGDWISQALRAIQKAHSFTFMQASDTVTILNAATSANMPARFKELQHTESPVQLVGTDGALTPCEISTQEKLARLTSTLAVSYLNIRNRAFAVPVFLDWSGSQCSLNVFLPVSGSINFSIRSYKFLPELVSDLDENSLTIQYDELVKAKIKAVAFEEISDPLGDTWENKYQIELRKAIRQDEYRRLSGRDLRLGG